MSDLHAHLSGFVAAYSILLVAASSPGPAVALLLGIANGQGRKAALITTLGITVGSMTINLLTLVGVGLLLSQAAWAMSLLRLAGAAYLLYLAWGAFRRAARPPAVSSADSPRAGPLRLFAEGYLLQVTNPKAIAFWLAIAAIGATEGGSAGVVVAFVAGAAVISFACHAFWALALSAAPVRRAYAAGRRWVEAGLGVFLAFAAFKLATSQR
ncbi:LysE family translocator [Marinibacterium sp. SX1]|uniref:LysE family translocator n=1 Tax=Marinibacterium sp. SX1 TaxID=3388424 RepID=UPI003D17ADEF